MIKIVQRIFKDNGFEKLEFNSHNNNYTVEFWANYNLESINFYLVIYLNELPSDFLEKDIPHYFEEIKSIPNGYDKQMDKNLSLLLFFDETNNKAKVEEIFMIEEDPYYFKKYFIEYNVATMQLLEKELINFNGTSLEFINSIINDADKFVDFKLNRNIDSDVNIYELCSKLMIKIPFINLLNRTEVLDDLTQTIDIRLKENKLYELKEHLLQTSLDNFTYERFATLINKDH